jgi:hypothetical protein
MKLKENKNIELINFEKDIYKKNVDKNYIDDLEIGIIIFI